MQKNLSLLLESIDANSEAESENMFTEDARSEADSNKDLDDDEEYETITISEAPMDENRYDQDIDMLEEKQAIEKL